MGLESFGIIAATRAALRRGSCRLKLGGSAAHLRGPQVAVQGGEEVGGGRAAAGLLHGTPVGGARPGKSSITC